MRVRFPYCAQNKDLSDTAAVCQPHLQWVEVRHRLLNPPSQPVDVAAYLANNYHFFIGCKPTQLSN